tara:strand:+ start:16 stop:504 length:489 start_codon:yes stop_codon:yes gene_type:complete
MKHKVVQKCHTCGEPFKLWNLNEPLDYIKLDKSLIPNAGLGVFAIQDIPKNIGLGWYRGTNVEVKEVLTHNRLYTWKFKSDLKRGRVLKVNPCVNETGNILAYVNSFMNEEEEKGLNTKAKVINDRVYYYTLRKIKKGEELIVDYGHKGKFDLTKAKTENNK